MKQLKRLNKWLTKDRTLDSTYVRLETSNYDMIAIGLAYGSSTDNPATIFELGIGIHCAGIILKLPNYWYKSSIMTNVKISADMTKTSYNQRLRWHKIVKIDFMHDIVSVSGYLNYRNDFIVTSVEYGDG